MNVKSAADIDVLWTACERAIGYESTSDSDLSEKAEGCAPFPSKNPLNELTIIEADELKKLILKHSETGVGKRLFLRGVYVVGRLNLEGLSGPRCCPLPELYFIQCFFERGVCFAGSNLSGLNLKGSRFLIDVKAVDTDFGDTLHHINLSGAQISGDLNLSHIQPVHDDEALSDYIVSEALTNSKETLTAYLVNARVSGAVSASYSTFAEDARRASIDKPTIGARTALNISGMNIGKNLLLCPKFRVEGGLKAKNICCEGEAWLVGCEISGFYRNSKSVEKPDVEAIDLQSATFHKALTLSQKQEDYNSTILGDIFLWGGNAKFVVADSVNIINSRVTVTNFFSEQLRISCPSKNRREIITRHESNSANSSVNGVDSVIKNIFISLRDTEKIELYSIQSEKVHFSGKCDNLELINSNIADDCIIACESKHVHLEGTRVGSNLDLTRWDPKYLPKGWSTLNLSQVCVRGNINASSNASKRNRKHLKTVRYSLKCYPDYDLIITDSKRTIWRDVDDYNPEKSRSVFSAYLQHKTQPERRVRLTGSSTVFHEINKHEPQSFNYKDEVTAIEYLLLFCAFTWGDQGPFLILSHEHFKDLKGDYFGEESGGLTSLPLTNGARCKVVDKPVAYNTFREAYIAMKDISAYFSDTESTNMYEALMAEVRRNRKAIEKQASENGASIDLNDEDLQEKLDIEYAFFIPATINYGNTILVGLFGMPLFTSKADPIHLLAEFRMFEVRNKSDDHKESEASGTENEALPECEMLSFEGFIKRSGGQGAFIKVIESTKPNCEPCLRVEDYLPSVELSKPNATLYQAEEVVDPEKIKRSMFVIGGSDRKAFVDLTNASCDSLNDLSGRGWGDEVIFQTDNFRFNSLIRRNSDHVAKAEIRDILSQLNKPISELASNNLYKSNENLTFFEQRLIWLCRHRRRENVQKENPNRLRNAIDGGTFRRVARAYRSIGLPDAAKYIDEARIIQDQKELRWRVSKQRWTVTMTSRIFAVATLLTFCVISLNQGFTMWANTSGLAAVLSLLWNQLTQHLLKHGAVIPLLYVGDIFFRLGFRYGLSLFRPIVTIFAFIAIGWWGTQYLDSKGFMVVETVVVSKYVGHGTQQVVDNPYIQKAPLSDVKQTSNVGCGTAIDYGIYALDIFVPLVELDQEERCMIRPFDSAHPRYDKPYSDIFRQFGVKATVKIIINHPTTWRILQTLYILFGWIIVSVSLLTFSGFLQRQAEGKESS